MKKYAIWEGLMYDFRGAQIVEVISETKHFATFVSLNDNGEPKTGNERRSKREYFIGGSDEFADCMSWMNKIRDEVQKLENAQKSLNCIVKECRAQT